MSITHQDPDILAELFILELPDEELQDQGVELPEALAATNAATSCASFP